jgi:hypothetical protein
MNRIEKGYIVICKEHPQYHGEEGPCSFLVWNVISGGMGGSGRNICTGEPVSFKTKECEEAKIKEYIEFLEWHLSYSKEKIPHDQKIEWYRARVARGIDERDF